MKYFLNSQQREEVGHYFSALDAAMEDAEGYNRLLANHTSVSAQEKPLPIALLKEDDYLKNPFFVHVTPAPEKNGNWELFYDTYEPNQGFVYDEISVKPPYFSEKTAFGYFEKPFRFLAIKEKGQTWMSVTPHEINTMKASLDEAKGQLLVFGLGLGYYAYMASLKDEVSSLTIIEKDVHDIALFKKDILPFFPHPEKITVVEEDAFHYANGLAKKSFDYAFVDLWHLPEDGLPLYLQMKKFEKRFPKIRFSYWVEESLLSLLRRAILLLLQEEMNGSKDEDYDFAATYSDTLINKIHFLYKKKEIHSSQDIRDLISDEGLRELAAHLG